MPGGVATASAESLEAAATLYKEALVHMGGNHPATQYYLGTCQLDVGRFEEGVENVAGAIKADPSNFDEEAHRRLRAGQQGAEMVCTALESKPDSGSDAATAAATWGFDDGHAHLVQVWDGALSPALLGLVAAAAAAHQEEQHKPGAARTVWIPAETVRAAARRLETEGDASAGAAEHAIESACAALSRVVVGEGGAQQMRPDEWAGCEVWVRRQVIHNPCERRPPPPPPPPPYCCPYPCPYCTLPLLAFRTRSDS